MSTSNLNRKRNKSSPLIENSPKKTKQYKSPQQLHPEPEENRSFDSETELKTICDTEISLAPKSQTLLHTPVNTSTPTISSRPVMESPEPSQSQSLLGGPGQNEPFHQNEPFQGPPGPPHNLDGTIQGINPPHYINPMMIGSPMNPGMLAYQGLPQGAMPPIPSLSDQDIIRIAAVIKQLLSEEIKQLVSAKVESATQSLKTELNDVQNRCTQLEKEVSDLKAKNDDIEQYSRRMCLRIAGLKEFDQENVTQRVLDFADNLNANINADDIDRAHRVGSRTGSDGAASGDEDEQGEQGIGATSSRSREIIIKFTNSSARLRLLQGRAKLRENNVKNVYINEDLTPARKELAYECRKLKRMRKSKVKKTWIYAGYPHILDKSGNKVKITCMSDLDDYREERPAPPQPMSNY